MNFLPQLEKKFLLIPLLVRLKSLFFKYQKYPFSVTFAEFEELLLLKRTTVSGLTGSNLL